MIQESPTTLISLSDLDSVASLRCDALHGEDDLEGVLRYVPRTHLVQGGLAVTRLRYFLFSQRKSISSIS